MLVPCMTAIAPATAYVDMSQPLRAGTARLRHAFSHPRAVLQAHTPQALQNLLQ